MFTSQIDSHTLICALIAQGHGSEMQRVVFKLVGHVRLSDGVCHVEVHVVLHPEDTVIRPSDVTGEREVVIVYWNCVVSDHH